MLGWLDPLIDGLGDWIGWILVAGMGGVAEAVRRVKRQGDDLSEVSEELEIEENDTRLDRHEDELQHLAQRLDRQQQYFEGDPNDPNSPGVLQEVHSLKEGQQEVRNRIEENRQERKQEHRRVVSTLENLEDKLDE